MKVLLVGGSGLVGSFVTPYLARHHELRVLDLRAPEHADLVDYVEGSISDPDAVARALTGMDSFINLVMRNPPENAGSTRQSVEDIINNYEVNTVGLHLLLWTAQSMGINSGVHTSTTSVHHRDMAYEYPWGIWCSAEETVPMNGPSVYGFTKGLGERICEYFAHWFDMRLIALRITGPRAREQYLSERRDPIYPGLYVTDEEDLADAYLAALEVAKVGRKRFDAVYIAGDESEELHNLTKARTLLGWRPRSQRHLGVDPGVEGLASPQ